MRVGVRGCKDVVCLDRNVMFDRIDVDGVHMVIVVVVVVVKEVVVAVMSEVDMRSVTMERGSQQKSSTHAGVTAADRQSRDGEFAQSASGDVHGAAASHQSQEGGDKGLENSHSATVHSG